MTFIKTIDPYEAAVITMLVISAWLLFDGETLQVASAVIMGLCYVILGRLQAIHRTQIALLEAHTEVLRLVAEQRTR